MEIDKQSQRVSDSNNNSNTTNLTAGSFGNQLRQARLKKNLTLEDVASELFILRRHLESIEEENFKELPQMAFSRGFVVNYAKFLGLDPEKIVESFNRAYPDELKKKSVEDIESPLKPLGTLQRDGRRPLKINPLLILGLIALIALAVFLIRMVTNAKDINEVQDAESAALVDDISDSEQSAGAAVSGTSATAGQSSGSALNLGDSSSNTEDSDNATAANENDAVIDVWVIDDTDLTVTDANNNSLINGQQPRGSYKLTGQPPFKVQIGNVSQVTMNLNGEPIKLNDFSEDNKANFTLSP